MTRGRNGQEREKRRKEQEEEEMKGRKGREERQEKRRERNKGKKRCAVRGFRTYITKSEEAGGEAGGGWKGLEGLNQRVRHRGL